MTGADDGRAGAFDFEGAAIPFKNGDTIAASLYRAGVRTFSRSFKYHRPRGLYCVTGDCPNCLINVDGEACVRACVTPVRGGEAVRRENGWPSVDRDFLRIADYARWLLPVGFYYKTFVRPAWLWPAAEKLLRRAAGLGRVDLDAVPTRREVQHVHPDVLVVGAGAAGLTAAIACAEAGETVYVCDERAIGQQLAPGRVLDAVLELAARARHLPGVTLLEDAAAIGIYAGLVVPVSANDRLVIVHPRRVIVATGAVEAHAVFEGNDLPGIFLSRGAALLAGRHGLTLGRRAVVVAETSEACENLKVIAAAGTEIVAAVVPTPLRAELPANVRAILDGRVARARGRSTLEGVVVETDGGQERISCDTLILGLGLVPRDGLLRQAEGVEATGVGDVVDPGCSLPQTTASARTRALDPQPTQGKPAFPRNCSGGTGFACLCEDVAVHDLELAWTEGFQSTELLKRYTTVAMGPCQGALCQPHLTSFVRQNLGESAASAATTARPPARPVTLEAIAAGAPRLIERRTTLDASHLELDAVMEPAGAWRRPSHYGDVEAEYWAVRQGVSIMDVGTLGKYVVHGRDAGAFLEQLYPCRITNLKAGRLRYALLLAETGYVLDDGLVCADSDDGHSWYLTFTSGGADHAEAWLKDWRETWGLDVHIANRTAAVGAINLAGPGARSVLRSLTSSPVDNDHLPYLQHQEIEVAGVPCRVIRLGFVGELSYELHHPSSQSAHLWSALLNASTDEYEVRPHGLEALRLLRLEKGHIIVDQDTDFDATPSKLGMAWAAKLDKPYFIGKSALTHHSEKQDSKRLWMLRFETEAPPEGAALTAGDRFCGYVTSSRYSPALNCGVALGWLNASDDGTFPTEVSADGVRGRTLTTPPYDPEGERLRA